MAAFNSLSGCARNQGDDSRVGTERDRSCEVEPGAGPTAVMASARPEIFEISFGKQIDVAAVEATYPASGLGVVDYIPTRGAQIVRVDSRKLGACLGYTSIAQASNRAQRYWSAVENDLYRKSNNSKLLGLYIPEGSRYLAKDDKAHVLVPPDTEKWTIVHEYMHHEFDRGARSETTYAHPDLLNDEVHPALKFFTDRLSSPSTGTRNLSNDEYREWKQNFDRLTTYLVPFIKAFMLEEVAIESRLFDAYQSGAIKHVPDFRDDAIDYMEANYGRVKAIGIVYSQAAGALRSSPHRDVNQPLVTKEVELSSLLGEAELVLQRHGSNLNRRTIRVSLAHQVFVNKGDRDRDQGHAPRPPCGRSHGGVELDEMLRNFSWY